MPQNRAREPQLRAARASDVAQMARMSRELIESGLPWTWRPPRLHATLSRGDHIAVVATLPGARRLCGFAVAKVGTQRLHLVLLAVAPEMRRRGIGRQLVTWCEQLGRIAGVEEITLEVRERSSEARRFYAELRFVERAHVAGYYSGREYAVQLSRPMPSCAEARARAVDAVSTAVGALFAASAEPR